MPISSPGPPGNSAYLQSLFPIAEHIGSAAVSTIPVVKALTPFMLVFTQQPLSTKPIFKLPNHLQWSKRLHHGASLSALCLPYKWSTYQGIPMAQISMFGLPPGNINLPSPMVMDAKLLPIFIPLKMPEICRFSMWN